MSAAQTTILVVEDEPLLRLAAIDMVEKAGFHALAAADATEAVRLLETHPEIRIVFTDIDMPHGMDGVKLAACIRDRWPPIAIILTSGHAKAADLTLPARSMFFPKPYHPPEVVAAFHRMAA
jgi:CheY-like chemotaxis protein